MSNDPVLIAYAVMRSKKTGRVNYERIGRAYPHNRGEGLTIILDAMPLKGRHIVLLELDDADERRLLNDARRHRLHGKDKAAKRAGNPG